MQEPLGTALRDWQSFYVLTGGSAATLAGLLFIALQFGTGVRYPAGIPSAIGTFVAPTFIRFLEVLVISALALIPTETTEVLAILLLVATGVSVWSTASVLRHSLSEYERPELLGTHWIWNVALPGVTCLLLLVSAGAVWLNLSWSLNVLAAATIGLLVTGLVSAWYVMTWIAQQHEGE